MTVRYLIVTIGVLASVQTAHAGDKLNNENTEPQFSRHVAAVFSRLGCNAGVCHGAVNGQNGFRLSLFAADPALDHERLVRESGGRRRCQTIGWSA